LASDLEDCIRVVTGCEVASTVVRLKDFDERIKALEDYMSKDEEERLLFKD